MAACTVPIMVSNMAMMTAVAASSSTTAAVSGDATYAEIPRWAEIFLGGSLITLGVAGLILFLTIMFKELKYED